MNLRDYLHKIAHSPTIEELWDAHTRQMADYGFNRLIYGFTRYRTPTSLGDPADFVILSNQSSEYLKGYLHSGLYFHAPMVRWALNNEGACSWGALREIALGEGLTETESRVIEFNRSMDVTAGYTISFRSISARSKGAIALTARPGMSQADVDAIWTEHGRDIQLMNEIAHLKILSLPYSSPNRSLTRRQLEVLEWVGDGKTTQDIALLMGLTAATVEKHLRLAREALSVETTAQAVLKAAFANQMFVMDT
ncbi:Transcriptional activator protein LuxR [Sulfitobacter indolifex]|uniref:Autoinducer-binding transcriptional regulator, LuxR family protein n=1 Tax=Sulfitobacter indolifex HEL-45 TaxID=391624 RepID=A0ABM9X5H2_9RHOB|nr:LuxR family transcriptional regulator [Sulfitobacter indolifex]EDQ04648.1 autoinducer-binding transcriptional regulator, LuxR family protein [Sulfitobacter indolifex HEL-45]UOA18742.1 Transcriptional activator protein LuxR [Sulfitobacter indolifex]